MLALIASFILPFVVLTIGYSLAQRVFSLAGSWRWSLAYTLGLAASGAVAYCLWLLNIPWSIITIVLTSASLLASRDMFAEFHTLSTTKVLKFLTLCRREVESLEPLESVLAGVSAAGLIVAGLWHMLIRPVVWDSLVLYDFRAQRIAEGWSLDQFFTQFRFDTRFAAYDFSHPFLSSIWQALAYSTQAYTSTFVYFGLLLSVLAVAWKILPTRKAWLAFTSLLFSSSLLFTVWTQNYAAEPYVLFWIIILLLALAPRVVVPRHLHSLVLAFVLTTLLARVSEPYWLVFLLWFTWTTWKKELPVAEKLLWLCFLWLPSLSVFGHWWQLQNQAEMMVQAEAAVPISSYDPSRYGGVLQAFTQLEFWRRWIEVGIVKSPVTPFVLLAGIFLGIGREKIVKSASTWLFLGFTGMLALALLVEMAGDWPQWQGKERLLSRAGLPVVAVSVVIATQQIETNRPEKKRFPRRKRER